MTTDRTTTQRTEHTIAITGMTCASCERRVSKALLRVKGVDSVDVSAARGTAVISGSPTVDRPGIDAAIRSAGYELGVTRWFTRDAEIWKLLLVTSIVIAWIAWVIANSAVSDFAAALVNPSSGGLLLVLTLGLTAGVSTCMAMVGGLVLALSASHAAALAASGTTMPGLGRRMRPHVVFNIGRIVGFGMFGAILGVIGSSLSLPTRAMGLLTVAVAVVMFLLGMRLTGLSPRMAAWSPRLPGGLGRSLGVDSAADGSYSDVRAAGLGAATFFLPCGFTQAVQVYALSTASPLSAGLIMATFAVGTTPGLLALASVPEVATGGARTTILRVIGVVVIAFALFNLPGGLRLLGITSVSSGVPAAAATAQGSKQEQAAITSNVSVANGVQTVTMTQVADGYLPADTVMYAGMPTTWVIEGTAPFSCSMALRVPDLEVGVNLVEGPNSLDLPAMEPGTTQFMCAMGMYTGTLTAVTPPASTTATPKA